MPQGNPRAPEISPAASKVSVFSGVRRALVEQQRQMGAVASVVMEGRDIGSVVFPDAEVKIYLDADPLERARRRLKDLRAQGETGITETELAAQIEERDRRDSTRADGPLAQAPDDLNRKNLGDMVKALSEGKPVAQ